MFQIKVKKLIDQCIEKQKDLLDKETTKIQQDFKAKVKKMS
jgi:hypothetical protein